MAGMLDGKSALITGGGGGIGRATALVFAREGARVAVTDFVTETAAETVALINAAGGQAMSVTADVTDAAQVAAMIKTVVATYGRLDCAFNNAGIAGFPCRCRRQENALNWSGGRVADRMVAVNLKGRLAVHGRRSLAADGGAQGGGTIVNTGSIAGLVGLRTSSIYVAAKHWRDRPDQDRGAGTTPATNIRVNATGLPRLYPHEHDGGHDAPARRGTDGPGAVPPHGHAGGDRRDGRLAVLRPRVRYVTGAAYTVDGGLYGDVIARAACLDHDVAYLTTSG